MPKRRRIVLLAVVAIVALALVAGVSYSGGVVTNEARPHPSSELNPTSHAARSALTNEQRAQVPVATPATPAARNDR